MKMRFESADEMRERIPIGATFRAYSLTMRIWSYEQKAYVPLEDKHPRRAVLEDENTVFVYNQRSHHYGQRLSIDYFVSAFMVDYVEADAATKWERRVKNVVKKLNASGLWPRQKELFENLLRIGYDRREKLMDLHRNDDLWRSPIWKALDRNENGAVDAYNAAFESWYGAMMNEFPFAFYKSERGLWCVDTFYVYEMSDCKTKSMYFGKWFNKQYKAEIADAIANKREYTARARTSYDVSFEYNPEKNMAWYSEEYKDCGNGHYYIAIDANTALFCEDD